MKNKLIYVLLIVAVLAALVVGMLATYKRIVIESKNSNVELAMDLSDIKKLSLLEGYPVDKVLHKLKGAGITSIAITEDTLETLELEGSIVWLTGYERDTLLKMDKSPKKLKVLTPKARLTEKKPLKSLIRTSKPNPSLSYAICDNPELLKRLKKELIIDLGNKQVRQISQNTLEITDDEEDLMNLGLGISPSKFSFILNRGFFVVPRLRNNFRLGSKKIEQKLSELKAEGPFNTVIFDGEEVLGYKNNVIDAAKILAKLNINYGYIEMAEQKGDSVLLKNVKTGITRVHSISEDEMLKKMTKEEALDRFERAVAERGVRLLYIRPFYVPDSKMNLVQTNTGYISGLRDKLAKTSHHPGLAGRLETISPSINALTVLSIGTAAGFVLLMSVFFNVPILVTLFLLVLSALAPLVFDRIGNIILFQKLAAMTCAVVFPSLSITSVFRSRKENVLPVMPIAGSILIVLESFAISMIGALLVIGLLADTLFMLGAQQFIGIKTAFVLPIFITAAYCALFEEDMKDRAEKFMQWLNSPITIVSVIVGVVVIAAGALYILRSGNFGIGIMGSEKAARDLLENLMVVRPRTKEFLIGYPALMLAGMYYLRGNKRWLWAFLLIGVVGPVSTLNTFCHVHSPLLLSLLRTAYGAIIGIAVGLIYYLVFLAVKKLIKA